MNINNKNSDIIVALATPYGRSALAVIRVSGKGCVQAVERHLSKKLIDGKIILNKFDCGDFTENLMSVCYHSPKSYTGEDVVELFPHGNMTICDGIIKTLVDDGARIAERGEFTERAFKNGKIDLMQCEALADIIDAENIEQLVYGNKRYNGGFKKLDDVYNSLKKALSTVEAVLHYSDELEENEIDERLLNDVYSSLDMIIDELDDEKNKFVGGKIVNTGFKVAIIGCPNVGKSTLLNALSGADRAIVTPIAGTTRDTVDGEYVYNNRLFKITDTAGIKNTDDTVEKIGIERTKAAAERADAIVYVIDGEKTDKEVQDLFESAPAPIKIKVRNKEDKAKDVGKAYKNAMTDGILYISAKLGKNIDALKELLYDVCPKDLGGICNHRQYACIAKALEACRDAKAESKKPDGLEIVAAALYRAYSAICELYGEQADESVISSVFERFCVGK